MLIQDSGFNLVKASQEEIREIVKGKFVIAIDFDGVVTSPYKIKTRHLNSLGYNVTEKECGPLACLKMGVSREDYNLASRKAYMTSPADLPLEKDFQKYLDRIHEMKDVIVFLVTSREDDMLEHLEDYLRFYEIRVSGVVNTNNSSKTSGLREIDARIFVEDSSFKIWQVIKDDPEFAIRCELVLYRNVQNEGERKPAISVKEVWGWKEILDIVVKLHSHPGWKSI